MRTETFLKKAVAGLGSAALVVAMSACAHHNAAADNQYGQIRTEAPATADNGGTTVAAVAAPANAQGVSGTSTPAAISGPVAVDSTGRAYTSSSVGSAGNASGVGTNTDTNLIPKKTASNVTVTQSPAVIESTTATTVETPAPAPVIAETPAPAPVIVETPAPAPAPIVETPAPMSSSTTETTTTTTTPKHRRMHKD
jgi:hypothetical protein